MNAKDTYEAKVVRAQLAPLFEKARKECLWFYCSYQQMWLSPNELEKANAKGRLLWGAVNWTLRPFEELEEQLVKDIQKANEALERFRQRVIKEYKEDGRKAQ